MTVETRRTECQIADWMVQLLSQHGFTESLYPIDETAPENLTPIYDKNKAGTVVRTYIPEFAFETTDSPRIAVVPFSMNQSRYSRNHMMVRYFIDVNVTQRLVGPPEKRKQTREQRQKEWRQSVTKNGDRVLKMAEQVQGHFESESNDAARIEGCIGCECARWINVEANPIYEIAEIDNKHLVMCLQRHQWMTIREMCGCG